MKQRLQIGVYNSHTMISELKIDLHLGGGNNKLISNTKIPCALVCWLEFTLDVPDSTKSSSKEIKYSQKVVSALLGIYSL